MHTVVVDVSDSVYSTRSERCNLVKYLYPAIYWRLYRIRVRSYNIHEITILVSYWNCIKVTVHVTSNLLGLQCSDRLVYSIVFFIILITDSNSSSYIILYVVVYLHNLGTVVL